jgi:predicted transcriptional regulator
MSNSIEGLFTNQTTEQRLDMLFSRMVQYEQQLIEVRRDVNREAVREEVAKAFGEKGEEVDRRMDAVVKALKFLMDQGIIDRAAFNEAVRP